MSERAEVMILPTENRIINLEAEVVTLRQDLKKTISITKDLGEIVAELNEDYKKFTKLVMDEVFKKEPE